LTDKGKKDKADKTGFGETFESAGFSRMLNKFAGKRGFALDQPPITKMRVGGDQPTPLLLNFGSEKNRQRPASTTGESSGHGLFGLKQVKRVWDAV